MTHLSILFFFFSSRRRHTRCALVTGVQTCALPISLSLRRRPDDAERLHRLHAIARAAGVRSVATGDVLYHAPEARPLQDVMTAIREKATIDELGFGRERFMDRALKSPEEMERRFAAFPDAIQASRTEEPPSELQSLMRISSDVFCLKKKN